MFNVQSSMFKVIKYPKREEWKSIVERPHLDVDGTASGNGVSYTPAGIRNLSDSTSATIGTGNHVTASGNISVLASDVPNLFVISGTVAVGGTAGVGAGVTVAVLHSNVNALVNTGAVLNAGGSIIVKIGRASCRERV